MGKRSKLFTGLAGFSDEALEAARKAARELRESKDLPTQPIFAQKPVIQEGAGLGTTGFAVSAERAVGTKGEKVNIPMDEKFMTDAMLAGARKQAERLNELEGELFTRESVISGEYTIKPDADPALVKEYQGILQKNAEALMSRNAAISQSLRGRPKAQPDDFMIAIDRKTGEINEEAFNRLTDNQQKLLLQDIRQRFKGDALREIEAKIEQARLQAGDVAPGESAIGTRSGTRGMMVRPEEKQVKEMLSGTERGPLTKTLSPETEEVLLKRIREGLGARKGK